MDEYEHITPESVDAELDALQDDAGADQRPLAEIRESTGEWRELLIQLLTPTFQLMAPAWNVQQEEINALGDAYAAVLSKYCPDGLSNWGPEITAGLTTVAIFGPRMRAGLPRKVKEKPPENPDKEPTDGS